MNNQFIKCAFFFFGMYTFDENGCYLLVDRTICTGEFVLWRL